MCLGNFLVPLVYFQMPHLDGKRRHEGFRLIFYVSFSPTVPGHLTMLLLRVTTVEQTKKTNMKENALVIKTNKADNKKIFPSRHVFLQPFAVQGGNLIMMQTVASELKGK